MALHQINPADDLALADISQMTSRFEEIIPPTIIEGVYPTHAFSNMA